MSEQLYNITRKPKDGSAARYLSEKRKRWLPLQAKHKFAAMTDAEAEAFIQSKGSDEKYWFLKTLKFK